jgi:hypothetical protein
MTGRFSPSTSITLPMLRHAWLSSIGCCGNMLRRIQMASSANTGRLLDRQQWADHDAALAKFASILRHKPRPLTKSQPPEFNKNPELISAE